MLTARIIAVRDVREAALLIGVGPGGLGAALLASATGTTSERAHGTGQEPFSAGELPAAGLMLAKDQRALAKHAEVAR